MGSPVGSPKGEKTQTKIAGGGVKKDKNSKKTGKLEPLLGNSSSLSTTQKQKQQKEKFRSYEIYRKQSERIYQRLREAKSQRGFRNEDDMMNFFRVLESSDTTIARYIIRYFRYCYYYCCCCCCCCCHL